MDKVFKVWGHGICIRNAERSVVVAVVVGLLLMS